MSGQQSLTHSVESTNLADLLERILDKGVVVAGDISIKLVEVELLTIQLRLVICSVGKACELGFDWWNHAGRQARVAQRKPHSPRDGSAAWSDRGGLGRRGGAQAAGQGDAPMSKDDQRQRLPAPPASPRLRVVFQTSSIFWPISTRAICRGAAGTKRTAWSSSIRLATRTLGEAMRQREEGEAEAEPPFVARRPRRQRRAAPPNRATSNCLEPVTDIFDEPSEIMFLFELPGVSRKDIHCVVDGDILLLEARTGDRLYRKEMLDRREARRGGASAASAQRDSGGPAEEAIVKRPVRFTTPSGQTAEWHG